jgi:hypothetical protein
VFTVEPEEVRFHKHSVLRTISLVEPEHEQFRKCHL